MQIAVTYQRKESTTDGLICQYGSKTHNRDFWNDCYNFE